ncbi:succinate dehydrogenase assembly factor 2 [Nitrosovibrio sp. Nv17]|uniref:FAD assembly factor SdhE n=1 Tax=Nitrosovibrio sp. Nv17 TaxID=1855339 RepID=UPI000908A36D|nr:antitoxin CptB [Nitrosovibrio sp. Nv17]
MTPRRPCPALPDATPRCDVKELERARWRCRRGLLELDIVLQRFMERHYPRLDATSLQRFETLLDLPDHDLWETIIRADMATDPELGPVLTLLRAA